ncbi:MAG: decaprenyl-phosphate phosphoribosyltransferase [Clostridiales bacterium]|nr:decaprenyl-phosphate phosphoribosyltransferase [Clostridiales bacterium]
MRLLFKLLRVKQWIKNIFVLAGIIFAGMFTSIDAWILTGAAILSFCLASSAIYIFNDTIDRKEDAAHPEKCKRPIASGAVKVPVAIAIMIILVLGAFALSYFAVNLWLFLCIASYIVMMILYSLVLKNIVIIDVMIIMSGFVLRAIAGVVALEVNISPWLVLCTALLSLYLALNKRRGEMEKLGDGGETRGVLKEYSVESIKEMLSIITPSIVVAYAIYTFFSPVGAIMMITLPFVVFGLFRYIYITDKKQHHDAPEIALLKDIPLIVDMLIWGVLSAALIMFVG